MSSIYAGGSHSTAISNILTEIGSCIVTQADGTEVLDTQALIAWVTSQLRQMITDAEATSDSYMGQLLQQVPAAVQTLADVIAPAHWSSRPDWPAHSSTVTTQQSASAAAVVAQQQKLKSVAAAATAFFADSPDILYNAINDYFNANVVTDIPAGVTLLEENRAYVYTYVTDRGEESAWSPVSDLIQCDQNDTVGITVAAPPSGRFVSYFRIYRSSTTDQSAAFQLLANPDDINGWPIDTLAITDDQLQEQLQEVGETQLWDEPPANLQGLVGAANGGMAGFFDNTFCPCVPYVGYAFPVALRVTTEYPIVGICAAGTTYFVGTRGFPYFVSGADNQSLTAEKIEVDQPCTSRKGMVAMSGGFVYPSPDGICYAYGGGIKVLTGPGQFNLFDRDTWQALDPTSIIAREYEGAYVFQWNNGTSSGMYSLDLGTGKLVTLSNTGSAFFRDAITDRLYVANGAAISAMFASATKRTGHWRTKLIELNSFPSFAWLQAQSEYEGDGTITVNIYGDGTLIQTETIEDREPVRVVQGVYREWEVEVESACRITAITLAEDSDELKAL